LEEFCMKAKKFVWIAAAILLAGMVSACDGLGGGEEFVSSIPGITPGGGGPVTFKGVKQIGGSDDVYLTTALTLNFSGRIAGLAVTDITLAPLNETNPDIKGEMLTGTGPSYTLTVSGIVSGGEVEVSVSKSGVTGGPHTVTVFYGTEQTTPVVFSGLAADGTGGTETLTLTFGDTIGEGGLTLDNIELNGGATGAEAYALSKPENLDGGGTKYKLYVWGISASGDVSVIVSKPGYVFEPPTREATVLFGELYSGETTGTGTPVAFMGVSADGTADKYPTTGLYLNFDKSITGLAAGDITLAPVGELNKNVEKGALEGEGPTYWLSVSGVAVEGFVKVSVSKSGYAVSGNPKTAAVHADGTVSSGEGSGSSGEGSGSSGEGSGSSGEGSGSSGGSGSYTPTAVTFNSLTANGTSQATATTYLTLEFGSVIGGGLTAENVILNPGSTGAVKGVLKGEGSYYTLGVSGITAEGSVSVAVNKPGCTFTPAVKTVTVYRSGTPVTMAVTADGSAIAGASETTTKLTLQFDPSIGGLTEDEITLASYSGAVLTKGAVTGSNPYYLPVYGITKTETITVSVNKSKFSIPSSPVTVYYAEEVEFTSVTANGAADTTPTTKLTLTFSGEIVGLAKEDITLSSETVKKEALSPTQTQGEYTLDVSGINAAGTIYVSVSKSGYNIDPVTNGVLVHIGSVTLNSVAANEATTEKTAKLKLTFSGGIEGLTADDIVITNNTGAASKAGGLEGSGSVYLLPVAVTKAGMVTVSVNSPDGYNISNRTISNVSVYLSARTLNNVTAVNSSGTTTQLTLTFSGAVDGLKAEHISVENDGGTVTGIGTLSGSGPAYTLPVTVTKGGNIKVSVSGSPAGYSLTGSPILVAVSYTEVVGFSDVTADGWPTETTTTLTLKFSKSVSGLTAGHIKVENDTGEASKAGDLGGNGTVYTLPVTVTKEGAVSVSVTSSPSGYVISGEAQTVLVRYAAPGSNPDAVPETTATPGTPDYLAYVKTYPMAQNLGDGTTTFIYNENGTYDEVHTFTATGSNQYLIFNNSSRKPATVEVLVVGGGGGGKGLTNGGGGGGSGGYVYHPAFSLGGAYNFQVTVGAGGASGGTVSSAGSGGSGGYSQFGSGSAYIRANGGEGANGSYKNGGSSGSSKVEGVSPAGATISPGYSGGGSTSGGGSGGGGAGKVGDDGSYNSPYDSYVGGSGGDGVSSSISGSSVTYAKGGSGGSSFGTASAGQPNTGNGGGGASSKMADSSGRAGGSGIVIVRWRWNP
jgi:hypothetical protein